MKNDVRLIDANTLKVRMFRSKEFNRETGSFDLPVVPWHDIEDADTIDAVPVVRCRECWKRRNERECPMCHEEFDGCDYCTIDYTSDDGFCHMGKKKDAQDMDVPTKDGGAE